tara:strand:+ start:4505 stop:5044 length:540 start_codon:yes stop_codon:yes gene_type:complete
MVSEYIAPFRKISDKKTVYDTKGRSSWSPKPNTPTVGNPQGKVGSQGKVVGNTRGLNKPIIQSNARIGGSYKFPATGRPVGLQQNKVGGAIGRTTARVLADRQAWSTAVNMRIHQQNLARAAKISKGINLVGLGLAAAEGIYKGAKRALGPSGTKFHTGTGVPVWEDRNTDNRGSKLNY